MWIVAVLCAFRLPRRSALVAVLGVGVLLRLAALSGPPTLSDDLYRYAWDGRVQAAGINPYRHAPQSPALSGLREPWLWPDAEGCAELGRPAGCTRINRPSERTIYPPLAQGWFNLVYRAGGIDAQHKAWQVAGLLTDLAVAGLLVLVLRAWRRDERWTALYALSPYPVVEGVNNAHVDGLAAVFVLLALLVAGRRRPGWAGAFAGAAALVKLYPGVVLAALVGRTPSEDGRWSFLGRAVAAAGVVATVAYVPHVIGVGARVLGYLPGYLREEQYDEGGRYLIAGLLGLPGAASAVLATAGVVAVVAWVAVARPAVPRAAVALLGAVLLAATPVQPWYAGVVLAALAAAAASPVWTLVAAAGYPYFFAVILDADHAVGIGRLSYGLALVAVAVGAWKRRPAPAAAARSGRR
jgi:hypothetical protein